MSDTIISVEDLGKSYILKHNNERGYATLRDVWAEKAKTLFNGKDRKQIANQTSEEFWALKNVSFEIKRGDAVGIIGRNGAGKSTLLKILSRITDPTEGKITLDGRVASLLEVGTGFHPELTGRENIFLNGAILGMSRGEIKSKFDEIVEFSGISKFLDTPVKRYSSGMYVRLAFSVAAHLEPEILIIDEVLAVGDAQFQKKCLEKMEDVSKNEGRTVLFVSHNINAIQNLCTSGILLNQGTLQYTGKIDNTVSAYLNSSTSSSNLWEGNYGNELIAINKTWVYSEGAENSIFSNDKELYFEIDVEVKEDLPDFVTGFLLNNSQGETILASYYNDFSSQRQIAKGHYKFLFKIPSYFLAVGSYSIDINVGIPYQYNLATNESTVRFNIVSFSEHGNVYMVDGNRSFNSLIRPDLFMEKRRLQIHER